MSSSNFSACYVAVKVKAYKSTSSCIHVIDKSLVGNVVATI